MWSKSKLKYTCQAFQEGIVSKIPISFGPRIKPVNSDQNPLAARFSAFTLDIKMRIS